MAKLSRRKRVTTIMGGVKRTGTYKGKSNRLGGGGRFQQVADKARASGASNPEAVAAAAGRKSLGKAKFQKLAAKGRRRAMKTRKQSSYRGGETEMRR